MMPYADRALMKFYLFIALLTSTTTTLAAEPFCSSKQPHPIDVQLEQDMDRSNGVTSAMREAQAKAYQRWDFELNRVYKELMAILPPEAKVHLREAQRSWLLLRSADLNTWQSSMDYTGTLDRVIFDGWELDLLRDRVCQLSKYNAFFSY